MSIKEFEVSNKSDTSGFVLEKANLQLNQSLESQFAAVTNKLKSYSSHGITNSINDLGNEKLMTFNKCYLTHKINTIKYEKSL